MNTVEGLIDNTICAHFGVEVTNVEFRGWLLSRINMSGKIAVLETILVQRQCDLVTPKKVRQMLETLNK